ncbi:MAG: hypothetical protein GF364_10215, partial [Candidatus Lokiarchaeota archaeon]|nr:hypothetical protein [Candidatus Lokiarchaeota archaeon]
MSQSQQGIISTKDALIRLSSILIFVAGIFQFFVGVKFIAMVNSGDVQLLSHIIIFVG